MERANPEKPLNEKRKKRWYLSWDLRNDRRGSLSICGLCICLCYLVCVGEEEMGGMDTNMCLVVR